MLKINKYRTLGVILLTLLVPAISFAQQGSSITVTRVPYLSFQDIPDSFQYTGILVPTGLTPVYSDEFVVTLPAARELSVSDTRECGGFNLQATTSDDLNATGSTTPIPASGFRIITSTAFGFALDGITNDDDHVLYLSGYVGPQGSGGTPVIDSPVYTASTAFGTATTFTDVTGNTLDATVDIMEAPLTAPTGRNGIIAVAASFYLEVPGYTMPGTYSTTITYTLTDATTGVCSS